MFDEFNEMKRTIIRLEQQMTSLRQLFYAACDETVPAKSVSIKPVRGTTANIARSAVQEFIDTQPAAKRVEGFKRRDMAGVVEKHGMKIGDQAISIALRELRQSGVLLMTDTKIKARYVIASGVPSESQTQTKPLPSSTPGTV
jgi:hypothetical protein